MESAACLHRGATQQRFDACQQFRRLEWLGHVIVAAEFETHYLVDDLVAGGEKQDRSRYSRFADIAAEVEPVAKWQHYIEDEKVIRRGTDPLHALIAVFGGRHDIAFSTESVAESRPQSVFVFNQQYAFVHPMVTVFAIPATVFESKPSAIRRCNVKTLPTLISLVTERLPPIASAICFATDRPSPVP